MRKSEVDEFNPRNWIGNRETWTTDVTTVCGTRYSFTTNGFKGGGWGHGGRMIVEIEDLGHTWMKVRKAIPENGDCKVSILVGGDEEMRNLAYGLEFLAKNIREALDRSIFSGDWRKPGGGVPNEGPAQARE
jgi:hypothetical protein